MPGRALGRMRRVAQIALAVLVLAPLLAGAHVHGFDRDASPACSVCTVAKHAPAVVAPVVSAVTIAYRPVTAAVIPAVRPCIGRCWRPAGRAPPSVLSSQFT